MMIVTKGKNLRISYTSGLYSASLAPYPMSLSAEFLILNHHKGVQE